jgi:hypothetical protein
MSTINTVVPVVRLLQVFWNAHTLRYRIIAHCGYFCLFLWLLSAMMVQAQPPIASWPFNGSANDVSGNAHHGTVFGASLTSDRFGSLSSAYSFDGVDDYIIVPDARDFRFAETRAFTISFWMKTCATLPYNSLVYLVGKGLPGNFSNTAYYVALLQLVSQHIQHTRFFPTYQSGFPLTVITGTWHHVVILYNQENGPSARREVWVDGVRSPESTSSVNPFDTSTTSSVYFAHGLSPVRYFQGALDDIRFYDRVITPSEIQALYTENGWPTNVPSITVNASALPPGPICPGDSVLLRALTTGPVQRFVWQNTTGPGLPEGLRPVDSGTTTVWVKPKQTTTYRAYISLGEPCPERQESTEVTVVVREGPQLPRGGSQYICAGDSQTIGGTATMGLAPYSYRWNPAPGITNLTQPIQRVSPAVSTEYYLTATDANGCRTRDTTRVIVIARPILAGLRRKIDLCRGDRDTIGVEAVAGSGNYRYRWSPASGISADTVARPELLTITSRQYKVLVTDLATTCTRVDSVDVVVHDIPQANAGADFALCRDSSMVIGSAGVAGVRYRWSPGIGLNDSTLAQPTARPSVTTTYQLTATDTLSGCTASDDITITLLDGTITPAQTTLDFGELDGCTSSRDMTVELTNNGGTDATLTAADISAAGFSVVAPSLPIVLKPGGKLSLVVRFSPGIAGVTSGTATLHGNPCDLETILALRGSKLASLVALNPSSVDFGISLACETVQRDTIITVMNNGAAPVDLGTPGIVAPYSIIAPSFPATIQPGDTLRVQVRYTPTRGTHSSDLRLPYQSGTCRDTLRIKLDGIHELPSLASDPASIDMGLLAGCTTSRDTTITLRNNGAMPLTIDSTQLPTGWRIVSTGSTTLLPGATTTLTLRYEPSSNGPTVGTLRLLLNPCAQEITIDLRGTKQGPSFTLPDTIDFGDVIFCTDSTVSRTFTLTYSGDTATSASVPSVLLVPSVPSTFSTNLTPGTILPPDTPAPFTVNFAPTTDGPTTAELQLRLEPCGVDRTIYLRGNRTTPRLTATPTPLDFGTITIGATATRQLSYINSGTVPIVVGRVDGLLLPFGLVATTPTLPAPLQPGDTLHVTVSYTGTQGTAQTIAQAVTTTPCTLIADAQIIGRGDSSEEAIIHLPAITGAPGDHIRVPIILTQGGSGLERIGARTFEGTLAFNSTMLLGTNGALQTSDATTRRVRFSGTRRDTSGTIAEVELIVLLGNAETTPLSIESFRWLDGSDSVTTRSDSGAFRLDGICRIGGTRLVNADGDVVLRPVRPSRGSDRIEIEYALAEDGATTLEIIDMQGRIVQTLVDADVHAGRYTATTYVGLLGSGRYLVVLRTPTLVATRDLEVVR